jgi:hypothetical protein
MSAPSLRRQQDNKEKPGGIHVDTVAHQPVAANTVNDHILENKGREFKTKSATRQLNGRDFQLREVRSELVDIVEKVFVIFATHASLLWLSQSG